MENFIHKVNYYETDRMGVTHHSNYIRFMEEARTNFLDKIGYPYAKMEKQGIVSPVVSLSVEYKKTTTFADKIEIEVKMTNVTPVRCAFEYNMTVDGTVVCKAKSEHCFLDSTGRPISLKHKFPELLQLLSEKQN